jgi:hypothetical protein
MNVGTGTSLCSQTKALIGRMGSYLHVFFQKNPYPKGKMPIGTSISALTGLQANLVRKYCDSPVPPQLPRCCVRNMRLRTRKEKWEKAAAAVEPFVQAKKILIKNSPKRFC